VIYLLPHTIFNSATKFPDKEAFKCKTKSLTFSEVAEQVSQLAALLHNIGINKSDRVGIYLNRSIETAIAIHGIMHAGAVYVPLDPKDPISRTRFLINDCGIKILVTNASQIISIQKIIQKNVLLDGIIGISEAFHIPTFSWEKLKDFPSNFLPPFPILETDVAYIIYTSGSTGNPKGIMHTHMSGLAYAKLTANLYQLTEEDRFGNHSPIYFDISTLGYFTAPYVGASTVIASDAHFIFPASLSQLIAQEKLTVWYSVPLAMIEMLNKGFLEERDMSSLRWVLFAGEPFPPKHLNALMKILSHTSFSNIYGPTETNQCTFYNISNQISNIETIPIGKVWENAEKILLDEQDNEVVSGIGELCIRSTTLMKGYWQKPELTRQSFFLRKNNINGYDPFYRTGDLVRLDNAGILHFIGRKDRQVKIRGYRIELDAIEAMLNVNDAVSEAAAFTVKNENEVLEIEVAVILRPSMVISASDLMLFLREKLPIYAIPSDITIVSNFPRTGSGKLNRSALKDIIKNEIKEK